MSGLNLNSITENASRLGMRLQETFSEHTRELAIAKPVGLSYFDNADDKIKNIRKQLDSNSDREKLDAMKRLVALISKGRNVSEYFAQVVKNVASQNLEIRKLVYIYLLRYAEHEPDLALLSINTFQKDLTDPNPLIRAMALRVLSGIKVPMIGSIVVLGIKKCAADVSPYVRKAAALAIPKCYNLDSSHLPSLISIITTLLRDRSPLSIGATSVAFSQVCPTRLDLLHPHYRRLCRTLADVDEWGQVELVGLLIRYARTMLPRPVLAQDKDERGEEATDMKVEEIDSDLQLLLSSSEPLFHSRNPAVVLAVTRIYFYLAPPSQLTNIVQPLLRLLSVSKEIERVVLVYILLIAKKIPHLFAPAYARFLIRASDIPQTKQYKMRVLLTIVSRENHQALLREFIDYAEDTDDQLVSDAIYAIGRCASLEPDCTQQCLTALLGFIKSKHDILVSNAVLVLKSLVQNQLNNATSSQLKPSSTSTTSIISHLAYRLDDVHHPQARACILWLVGQYSSASPENGATEKIAGQIEGVAPWAPDVLRKAAKMFVQETPLVKLQTTTLAAKLLVLSPTDRILGLLGKYVFSLARYDQNYDVRDRARMLSSLLIGVVPSLLVLGDEEAEEDKEGVVLRREQVRMVLFEGKEVSMDEEKRIGAADDQASIGTLSAITGKEMRGDTYLPDWLEQGTEPSLRDTEDDLPQQTQFYAQSAVPRSIGPSVIASPVVLTPTEGPSPAGSVPRATSGRFVDLEKFYADDSEEQEDEGEEEDEEDGDEDQQDEEQEDEDDEGSDEQEDEDETGDEEEEPDKQEKQPLHTVGIEPPESDPHW